MKTLYFLHPLIALFVLAFPFSCKQKDDEAQGTSQSTASIKVTRAGTLVTEYNTTNGFCMSDGTTATVIINGQADNHTLLLEVNGFGTGKFPIQEEVSSKRGHIMYQSYDLPPNYAGTVGVLVPNAGELTIQEASAARCKGSFTRSGKNAKDGNTYTIEGSFDIPVKKT
jgi:hypothetical protein